MSLNTLALFENVKIFVFDIDGVLTDGMLLVQENGDLLRSMNIKDGYALQLAVKKGYTIWVISGGKSEGAKIRLQKLGIDKVFIGVENKASFLQQLMDKFQVDAHTILYMGDDMPDVAALQMCGVRCCPYDAVEEVKALSQYISPIKGGAGCVRDVIEKVLKLNADWQ